MEVFSVLIIHTKQKFLCIVAELSTEDLTFERVR